MKQNLPDTALRPAEKLLSTHKILNNVWGKGYSAAYYRLPGDGTRYLLIEMSSTNQIADPELETIAPGFILAPFEHRPETKKWYIYADIIIKEKDQDKSLLFINQKSGIPEIEKLVYNDPGTGPTKHPGPYYVKSNGNDSTTSHDEFTAIVKKAVNQIKEGVFQKAVPARQLQIPLPEPFNPLKLFDKLCEAYPGTFVYLVTTPETGTWIGASPEILLKIGADKIFRTTALAGTQPYVDHIQLTDVAWTQKDIEEQAMVSRYIINCFKKIRLREFDEAGPKTIKAGNLIHLKTNYTVDLKKVHFPQLGTVMLKLLHPTSAVCGLPEPPAMDFLRKHESFNRSFFSGYLGPVNVNDEIQIYVNIRCMNLLDRKGLLFAGAGVTIDSKPEKEWVETEIKLKTLLDFI